MLAEAGVRGLEIDHVTMHRAALGRAAANDAADAVFGHEVEPALRAALDRLPAFHRLPQRARHQGQLLQRVAAIRHLRRQRVVLAFVGEALAVERLEDDVDLLLEQLAVGRLIEQRRAEGLHLARVIAAAHAEYDAAAAQDVRHRVVLGEAQRMPHRRDVEAAADLQALGDVRQMQRHHQHVGDALIAFGLEVMLRHPECVVAHAVHQLGHRLGLGERGGELLVRIAAVVDRDAAVAHVLDIDMAGERTVEFGDHWIIPSKDTGLFLDPLRGGDLLGRRRPRRDRHRVRAEPSRYGVVSISSSSISRASTLRFHSWCAGSSAWNSGITSLANSSRLSQMCGCAVLAGLIEQDDLVDVGRQEPPQLAPDRLRRADQPA